ETKMPSANVYDMGGNVVREEELDSYVFGAPVNTALLHQVVTAQLVNRRQGNASTKTRAEVSGGNKKPYRQKGTGHARQGSTRAPHYRGGGSVFGPRPHPYESAVPRKMKRIAIRAALSDKAATGHILLMDELTFEEPRTRAMEELLTGLPLDRHVLLLLPERNENVILSARNIHRVKLGNVASINVVELLKYDHLLMPLASVGNIVDAFGMEADDRLQMKRHPNVVARRQARRAVLAAKTASTTTEAPAAAPTAKAATRGAKAATTATSDATSDVAETTTASEAKSEDGGAKRSRSRSRSQEE
ncbi:MAG: 50S ribosomal protein L4, partial [Ktedonobacterales bacterium]